jgi:hypothetical protein
MPCLLADSAAGGLPEILETKARPPFSTGAKSGRKAIDHINRFIGALCAPRDTVHTIGLFCHRFGEIVTFWSNACSAHIQRVWVGMGCR